MPTTEAGVQPQQENQPKRGDDGCPFHEGALFGQPTRLAPKQEGHDEQAEENPGLGVKQAPLCAPQEVGHDSGSRDQAQNSPKIGNVLGDVDKGRILELVGQAERASEAVLMVGREGRGWRDSVEEKSSEAAQARPGAAPEEPQQRQEEKRRAIVAQRGQPEEQSD